MQVRWARADDALELGEVFFAAVREGPSLYSEAERKAWLPEPPHPAAWVTRLAANDVAVAEAEGRLVGFMMLDAAGYIDLAFVLPAYQRQGVFRAIYDVIEARARMRGIARLRVHASLMAQPAFREQGFLVIQHETVDRGGQYLRRAEMEKSLA
jgi:putative acetyltransferase